MKRLARRGLVLTALAAALCLFCEGWGETGDVHAAAKNLLQFISRLRPRNSARRKKAPRLWAAGLSLWQVIY